MIKKNEYTNYLTYFFTLKKTLRCVNQKTYASI